VPSVAARPSPDGGPVASTPRRRLLQEIRGYAEALAIVFLVVTFVFTTVGVVGPSMRPNLHGGDGASSVVGALLSGDRVFIPKYDTWLRRAGILGPYERGDIIVVRDPPNAPSVQEGGRRAFLIKRVIGVPGDRVRIEAGDVFVNGHRLDQGFITASGEITPDPEDFPVVTQREGRVEGLVVRFAVAPSGKPLPDLAWNGRYPGPVPVGDPRLQLFYGTTVDALAPLPAGAPERTPFVHDLVVPEGHYFVMGDNRERARMGSEDSRVFGPVRALTIGGKATAVIWPPRRDGAWNWRVLEPPAAFRDVPGPMR
jgi:signal peptidase I